MNLAACLTMTAHRYLMAIAHTHQLHDPRHTAKDELVRQLIARLGNSITRDRMLDTLSPHEQAALQHLATRDGRMSLHDFTRAFGPLRPYRPWRDAESSKGDGPTHPWRHPSSTTESLLYKGLIYLTPSDPQRRRPRYVILPAEFLEPLLPDDPPAYPELAPLPPGSSPPFNPVLDLALFLAYLQHADVHPLHGRWLSPRHLRTLGPCLSPPQPCQNVRSELQSRRIAFIHYLAESLHLVAIVGDRLKPSPNALTWLSQPPTAQLQALRQAWLCPSDDNHQRWTRYRLPGHDLRDPTGFARRLAHLLATLPADVWLPLSRLHHSPHLALDELVPWWEREESDAAQDLLHATLHGPLSWLGVVKHQPGSNPSQTHWCLTPLGAWLLGSSQAAPPRDDPQPLTLTQDLILTLPSRPHSAGLLALAEWAELSPGPQLRLTPASLARALERGGATQDLFAVLTRYAAPPLTPSQRKTLQHWAQAATPVTIRPCVLLETPDPDRMVDLWDDRSIRPHLGQQLTAELATLQTPDPDDFVETLRRRGLTVRSLLAGKDHKGATNPLRPGEAFWLAVALLVHAHLARRLSLTSVPPAAVLHSLSSYLGPAGLAAAQAAASDAITRLDEALDGPGPLAPAVTQDQILHLVEAAIRADQPLHIRYWSAWRGEVTERRVQPQRIEWRGDRLYLIAHCHLRRAQRTFRLDRILELTPFS